MKQIDTRGKLCPVPLILTKKGLRDILPGEEVEILTDNDTACSNLLNYLTELKLTPSVRQEGETHVLRLVKPDNLLDTAQASTCCATPSGDYVVVIKSETMGDGDDELGHILLRAFINSLKEAERLPSVVVLYNAGVKLALAGTDTARSLQELEDRAVLVLACGTCVDFYGVKERLSVGTISNMYKLTQVFSEAGHLIYP